MAVSDQDHVDVAETKGTQQQLLLLSAEIMVIPSALKLTAYLVQEMKKDKGWELDARLLGYAWGLQHSQAWNVVQS